MALVALERWAVVQLLICDSFHILFFSLTSFWVFDCWLPSSTMLYVLLPTQSVANFCSYVEHYVRSCDWEACLFASVELCSVRSQHLCILNVEMIMVEIADPVFRRPTIPVVNYNVLSHKFGPVYVRHNLVCSVHVISTRRLVDP